MEDTPKDWQAQAVARAIRIEGEAKYGVPTDEEVK